jgi:hypothetical protein
MKKFLVIVIALVAAGGSAYYLFEKGMDFAAPMGSSMMSSSASSDMKDFMDTLMPEKTTDTNSEETILVDAGLASSSSKTTSSSSVATATKTSGAYADYTDGVIGNGEASALFFHDKTSADSKATDAAIKALYKSGSASVTTYRVDIDGFTKLKTTYDIVQGNTVVLVDADGKVVKTVQNPTPNELSALLK